MGIDLRQKTAVLQDKEQIFRSFKAKFITPDKKFPGHLSAAKFENYKALYTEIQRYCSILFNTIWNERYASFDVNKRFPKLSMLRYTDFDIESRLSGQFKNQCIKHVSGIFNSFAQNHNFDLKSSDEKLCKEDYQKPRVKEFEISFCWADVKVNPGLSFVQINGCGEYGIKKEASRKIIKCKDGINRTITHQESVLRLPFTISEYHRRKFLNDEWTMSAPSLCKDGIRINVSKLIPKRLKDQRQNKKQKEFIPGQIGCDQGIVSPITLAYRKNGEIVSFQSPSVDKQGWSMSKIIKRMRRCKRGSKQYARYQKLRANFIRWSINQAKQFIIDNDIKVIALEDIRFMGRGVNQGSFLSKFEHSLIREKLNILCEDCGASLLLSSNSYRSQRCHSCGWTQKANRNGKAFECKKCGEKIDADLNAALNHSVNLKPVKRGQLDNDKGEYWKEIGKSGSQSGVNSVPNDPEPLVCA